MSQLNGSASRYSVAAGLLTGLIYAATPALAQVSPPNFSPINVGWVAVGTDWRPKPGSPR